MGSVKKKSWVSFSPKAASLSWQLVILIALALVRGLIYLSLFPPWVAPDEPAHFEVIRIIGQEGQIPLRSYYQSTAMNPELSQSFQTFRMWELLERPTPTDDGLNSRGAQFSFIFYPYPGKLIYADSHPILPYLLLAPISNLSRTADIATELYILRLVSVLFVLIVIAIAWLITKRIFPNQPQFWLAIPAFIVFLPMHTHIFASVNTDVFAVLLTSILLFVLVSLFDTGASKTKIAVIAALVFLAFFTKRTVVFTALWAGVMVIFYVGYCRHWSLKKIILISSAGLLFFGAGLGLIILFPELLASAGITLFNMNFAQQLPFALRGLPLSAIVEVYAKSALFALITFWGNFGGATTNIPWSWAWGLLALSVVLIWGAGVYIFRAFQKPGNANRFQRNVFIIFISGTILSLLNAFFPVLTAGPTWGPPARYFFPIIIPIATFFYLGAWQLCPPKYRQTHLLAVWLAALVAYDTLVIVRVLLPFLYG